MATPKKTRRWTAVPVSTIHGQETLDQGIVLEEIALPLGGILWKALRDILLWSGTPVAKRAGLFSETASRIEKLAPSIQVITGESALKEAYGGYIRMLQIPHKVREAKVAESAAAFSEWAADRGSLGTALAFAQAAALADPQDAHAAWGAGRIARRRADYYRAKGWFVAAIKRGRDGNQWLAYYRGHTGLGYVAFQRGNLPRAEFYFERAHRSTVAHGLTDRIAPALHNLMWIATERGHFPKARRYAEAAARGYPHGHARLPNFGGDYGYLLLEEGRFGDALRVMTAVLLCELSSAERLVYVGNLARAAGGAQNRCVFQRAVAEAEALMQRSDVSDSVADASLSIARGAAMLGEWDHAVARATHALEMAKQRDEGKIEMMAESFLESARSHRAVAVHAELACEPCSQVTERLLTKLPAVTTVAQPSPFPVPPGGGVVVL